MERLVALWMPTLSSEQPDGSSLRDFIAVVDAVAVMCPFVDAVRLGLCVFPMRGPSRFFGGDDAVLEAVHQSVRDTLGIEVSVGVAEGLFSAEAAAQRELVVAPRQSTSFRRSLPVDVLGRRDVATTCRRLGLHTVGAFADLDPARVAERFSRPVTVLHRVARGELSEAPTQRDPRLAQRLRRARGEEVRTDEQVGFFGQRGAGDDRAREAAMRVRHRLGPEGVLIATLRGGRSPDDRSTLVPFDSPTPTRRDDAPWPGQLRSPSPMATLQYPVAVGLWDERHQPIRVGARGLLSAPPASVDLVRGAPRRITWHAGPWPLVESWWSVPRRRAHLQILTDQNEAFLLSAEDSRWWLLGIYD